MYYEERIKRNAFEPVSLIFEDSVDAYYIKTETKYNKFMQYEMSQRTLQDPSYFILWFA